MEKIAPLSPSVLQQKADRYWRSLDSSPTDDAPSHLVEFADDIYRLALASLSEKLEFLELVTRGKAPCGHWSAYSVTADGGKLVTCLQCRAEKAEAALSSSQESHAENKRFVLATLNAIGEISVQEAMTAIEKEWPK